MAGVCKPLVSRQGETSRTSSAADRLRRVAASPVDDVVPHPVLDVAPSATDRVRPGLDRVVFGVTAALALAFLVWGFISTDSLASVSGASLGWTMDKAGWLFVITASGFVVFVLWLALSRFGAITLGRDDEEPEFRTTSWVAMMFSAGMGIGLMFWGVSEPIAHLTTPPPGTEGGTEAEAMKTAMSTTLFHWTLHPWAIYAVVGLAIAYGVYRKGRVQLISAAFEPLLGRHARGPVGKVIDMLAIFATLFGSAASLGLGALQIGSGLEIVAGLDEVGNGLLVMVIVVLTVGFVASAVSGVARGIQWLSNINMVLALVLALFVFLVGPTIFVLNLLPTAIGGYVADLPTMAARTGAEGGDTSDWLQGWTVFYWAWWLSWTPFVGMFIARISRGRTIRQFVSGVLLVPSLVSLVWFCIFGGAAIDLQSSGAADIAGAASTESQLFTMLEAYPAATATSILVMVLVGIFFISGADAASIVMGTLSERGTTTPRRGTVVFWGVATGAVAAVMLLVGGSEALNGLQSITIVAALPFVLVMVGLAVALVKDLRADPVVLRRAYAREAVEQAVIAGVTEHGDDFVLSIESTGDGHDDKNDGDDQLVTVTTTSTGAGPR